MPLRLKMSLAWGVLGWSGLPACAIRDIMRPDCVWEVTAMLHGICGMGRCGVVGKEVRAKSKSYVSIHGEEASAQAKERGKL